jgi:nicotinate-nucleotide adenylyltransferase
MNVAIFGGTFDPVHRGHLAVARAAQRGCKLGRIYFVPADVPPHKQRQPITAFEHRYAMLAIALRGEKTFIPSLIEKRTKQKRPNYTIDTVRRFKQTLADGDRLFFILGIDMFETIGTWYEPEKLMREVEFIVVSRPGFRLPLSAGGKRVHLVTDVSENVSSTKVRAALERGRVNKGLIDEAVIEYIRKEHLYETSTA